MLKKESHTQRSSEAEEKAKLELITMPELGETSAKGNRILVRIIIVCNTSKSLSDCFCFTLTKNFPDCSR